jgi:cysteine-rich repeat protein
MLRMLGSCVIAVVLAGCSCGDPEDADAGSDASSGDAGGTIDDAGSTDAGSADAGPADASSSDAGVGCGNGNIEPPEDCDDGNTSSGDGCNDICELEVAPGCGNGVREIGEACDDGNAADLDACLTTCVAAQCGDGLLRNDLAQGAAGYEACDDGNRSDVDGCLDGAGGCALASCGDSVARRDLSMGQAGYEECDDGNGSTGDGCDASCLLEGTCGNGTPELGEMCDQGSANDDEAPGDATCAVVCRRDCTCPSCGDGVTDFARNEQCDDGGTTPGDGCDASCHIERPSSCGDDMLDIANGEECDDGDIVPGDGCDASCQLEPVGGAGCGDGSVTGNEACDPPEVMPADGSTGCNATCNLTGNVVTLATGIDTTAIASDDRFVYVGLGDCMTPAAGCGIGRIDVAGCLLAPGTSACAPTFISGGGATSCACGTTAPTDGAASSATFAPMQTITTDGATIWIGNSHTIREVDIATGAVTTVAGRPNSCAAVDGSGMNAYFNDIRGLTYWNGSVYLLDGCEQVLRRYDPATRTVVTIGGRRIPSPSVTQSPPYTCPSSSSCTDGTPAPGYGLNAVYGSPRYMTADNAGNLYFIDTNGEAIWRFNTATTYSDMLVRGTAPSGAGNLPTGTYTDGTGSATNIGRARGIASDGTSIYFGEQRYGTVRQLQIGPLVTTTLVGAEGCAANDMNLAAGSPAVRDGVGADTRQLYCRGGGATPAATVPIFNTLLGAMTFNWRSNSLFVVDGGNLRRIE